MPNNKLKHTKILLPWYTHQISTLDWYHNIDTHG